MNLVDSKSNGVTLNLRWSPYFEILRASGIYSLAIIVQRLASILLVPLYTRYLTPKDYGVLELLDLTVSVFTMLAGGSFASALFYHYFESDQVENRKKIVSTTLLGSILLGLIGSAIGCLVSSPLSILIFNSDQYSLYFRILFVNLAVSLPLEACLSWLKAINRPGAFMTASILRLVLAIALNAILLISFHMSIDGVLWSTLICSSITALALMVYCFSANRIHFDLRLFLRLFKYSVPIGLSGLALFVIHFADRFFLQRYATLSDIGIYSLGYKLGMLISYVHTSFHTYWSTQIYQLVRGEKGSRMITEVFTYLGLVLTFCAVVIVVFAEAALELLATPAFRSAVQVVPWIAAAYVLRGFGDFFRCLFFVENRPGLDARLNWTGAAFCFALYCVLIPKFKLLGAAAATTLTFLFVGLLALHWTHKLRPFTLEWARLIKIGVAAMLAVVVFAGTPRPTLFTSAAIAVVSCSVYPLVLIVLGFLNNKEKYAVKMIFARLFRRASPVLDRL